MNLYLTMNSPYARKVRMVACELGLESSIHLNEVNPRDPAGGLWSLNPLGKVPVLVTESGNEIYDSPVICEYLISLTHDQTLIPTDNQEALWRVRTLTALIDGILDAGMAIRLEHQRPREAQLTAGVEKQINVIERGLDALQSAISEDNEFDLVSVGAICALDWLKFRHKDLDFLRNRNLLNGWRRGHAVRYSVESTLPS